MSKRLFTDPRLNKTLCFRTLRTAQIHLPAGDNTSRTKAPNGINVTESKEPPFCQRCRPPGLPEGGPRNPERKKGSRAYLGMLEGPWKRAVNKSRRMCGGVGDLLTSPKSKICTFPGPVLGF
ncbi:hypothetical protein J6590_078627 [Homalodisca vitripennis]|nr:hypothetical protein J6590_078627 [Homalodisca vitripennis]